jgi:hypothetical protein
MWRENWEKGEREVWCGVVWCGVVREWNLTLPSHLAEVRSVQMETKNLSEAEK